MRNNWQYHRGEWTEIADPFPQGESVLEKALTVLGYESWSVFGDIEKNGAHLLIYRGEKETTATARWQYVALFSPNGDACELVWCTDLPSLLLFIKDFAPSIQAQERWEQTMRDKR